MAGTTQTSTTKRNRFWEIDLFRTIAVAMMITYHVLYLLDYFGIKSTGVPGPYHGLWWWVPVGIVSTFTLLAGMSVTITYSKGKPMRGFMLRGLQIFGWGMLITLLTWIIDPHYYVQFGILHFFGVAFILAPFFARFRYVNLILGAAIIAAGIYIGEQGIPVSSPWLLWLMPSSFGKMDYWPLLPCFGIFLVGMFCGSILYPQGDRRFSIPDFNNRALSALTLPGRHPLVIYLAQWPALIGILLLLFPANVLPYFPFQT
jgi:uncharacterized membrane protein